MPLLLPFPSVTPILDLTFFPLNWQCSTTRTCFKIFSLLWSTTHSLDFVASGRYSCKYRWRSCIWIFFTSTWYIWCCWRIKDQSIVSLLLCMALIRFYLVLHYHIFFLLYEEKLILLLHQDGTWDTVKGCFTVIRDFADCCFHSYLSFMQDLRQREPPNGEHYEIRFVVLSLDRVIVLFESLEWLIPQHTIYKTESISININQWSSVNELIDNGVSLENSVQCNTEWKMLKKWFFHLDLGFGGVNTIDRIHYTCPNSSVSPLWYVFYKNGEERQDLILYYHLLSRRWWDFFC